jgi:hypothetical protein
VPKIAVVIEYDTPDDPLWLNPDNVALCLHAYCQNTKFSVSWAAPDTKEQNGHIAQQPMDAIAERLDQIAKDISRAGINGFSNQVADVAERVRQQHHL